MKLPELLWHGGGYTEIWTPSDWQVEVLAMRGARRPPLGCDEIAQAIARPIGSPPLQQLARGRNKAVVLFDDMTRPTPVALIAPPLVEALLAGGIAEDRISFVCALGAHGALDRQALRKKVGDEILARFRVYNHNCYENCVKVGTTSRGTPVRINREVMSADLKIGIGCVTAHPNTGFSGGGKIVLPGVAHIDSITHFHLAVRASAPSTVGFGRWEDNVMRLEVDEAAQLVGLDFNVDVVLNEQAEAAAIFTGELARSHRKAVRRAIKVYALPTDRVQREVAIVNALAKPNELLVGYLVGLRALRPRCRGTIVVLANAPDGQVVHYLLGRFGERHGGRKYPTARLAPGIDLIVQAPRLDRSIGDWFADPEPITCTRSWDETLQVLTARHGRGTRAVVIPNGTMAW